MFSVSPYKWLRWTSGSCRCHSWNPTDASVAFIFSGEFKPFKSFAHAMPINDLLLVPLSPLPNASAYIAEIVQGSKPYHMEASRSLGILW